MSGTRSASVADHHSFSFGEFVLDIDRGALLKDGVDVPLRPKCFQVLCYLVEHHGLLVTKDELFSAVWANVIVTEDSLTHCVIEIRKALGDDSRSLVRTVPRRGYLFDGPVTNHERGGGSPGSADTGSSAGSRRPSRWSVAAAIVLTLAMAASWWSGGKQGVNEGAARNIHAALPTSIAILPFEDMSPAGDQEYFADGISEEVLNLLAQISELTVIARTSSFSFKGENADIDTIARKLNVANVLEGSVRKNGEQVRITAQLVDASNSAHLWSQTYDRKLDDIFAVQDEIAESVATVLKDRLLSGGRSSISGTASGSHNTQAYEHYLKGKFFHSRRGSGDEERTMRQFQQALEINPGLADAWVGLAGAIVVMAINNKIPWEESVIWRKEALDKALKLNPNHAEAHIRLAQHYRDLFENDTAQRHFDRAMELGQRSALVLSIAAGHAYKAANFDQAIALQRRAAALDPLGYVNRGNLAHYLYAAGRLDEARLEFLNALELNPEKADEINQYLALTFILQRRYEEAEALMQQLPEGPRRDHVMIMIGQVLGGYAESDVAVERFSAAAGVEPAVSLVEFYAFRGNFEESFRWLFLATDRVLDSDHVLRDRHSLRQVIYSPFLKPMHDDPRWAEWIANTDNRIAATSN